MPLQIKKSHTTTRLIILSYSSRHGFCICKHMHNLLMGKGLRRPLIMTAAIMTSPFVVDHSIGGSLGQVRIVTYATSCKTEA